MNFDHGKQRTPVIFRVFKEGAVIALFPTLPGTNDPATCNSYQHVGQHGSADPRIIYVTRPAKPEEYATLKRELEGAPYGYKLKVYSRMQRRFDDERRKALKR